MLPSATAFQPSMKTRMVLSEYGCPRQIINASSKNQMVAYISQEDFRRVSSELLSRARRTGSEEDNEEVGGFTAAEEGVLKAIGKAASAAQEQKMKAAQPKPPSILAPPM